MSSNIESSVAPPPTGGIRQADLVRLIAEGRVTEYPVAVRTAREVLGGGFADQEKYPNTWTAYFFIDGEWIQVLSARSLRREWASLDKLELWLRSLSFRFFFVRNDLDPVEPADRDPIRRPGFK